MNQTLHVERGDDGRVVGLTEDRRLYTVEVKRCNMPSTHLLVTGTRGGLREPAFSFRSSPFLDDADLHAIVQEAIDRDRAAVAAVDKWMAEEKAATAKAAKADVPSARTKGARR